MNKFEEMCIQDDYENISEHKLVVSNEERFDRAESMNEENIFSWIKTINNIDTKNEDDSTVTGRIKNYYHDLYIIKKENFPESYFVDRIKQTITSENSEFLYTKEQKEREIQQIQEHQKQSLDLWIDYLTSLDSNYIPTPIKSWILEGVVQLGKFNKTTTEFEMRHNTTTSPFPEINREALAYLTSILEKKYSEEYIDIIQDIRQTRNDLNCIRKLEQKQHIVHLAMAQVVDNKSPKKTVTLVDHNNKQINIRKKDMDTLIRNHKALILCNKLPIIEKLNNLELCKAEFANANNIPEHLEDIKGYENFGKWYAYAITKLAKSDQKEEQTICGKWIKYEQCSNHEDLFRSIYGKGTGWCTAASEDIAKTHINSGDFYVYYSNNKAGVPTNPRIAIRMKGKKKIEEIRGVGPNQELDKQIRNSTVLDMKLEEFGVDGDKYKRKFNSERTMLEIIEKESIKQNLNKEDLSFLYGINGRPKLLGYNIDTKIKNIINKRDVLQDLSIIFDCNPTQISFSTEKTIRGGIKYHYGDLSLKLLTTTKALSLPENVYGDLDLSGINNDTVLVLPQQITKDLKLSGLFDFKDLILPEKVGGNIFLENLTRVENLSLPNDVGGSIFLGKLTESKELLLPIKIGGSLDLSSLKELGSIKLPEYIGEDLILRSVKELDTLFLPMQIGGSVILKKLNNFNSLYFPSSIGGNIDLSSIVSFDDLLFPESVGGSVFLSSLIHGRNLVLPHNIGGSLYLSNLTFIENLILPEKVGGHVFMQSIKMVQNDRFKILPKEICGNLYLGELKEFFNIEMPQYVGGDIYYQPAHDEKREQKFVDKYQNLSFIQY